MVKITSYKPSGSIKSSIKSKVSPGKIFQTDGESSISDVQTSTHASSIHGLNLLTGLQEVTDLSLRERLQQKGKKLLNGLDILQKDLLHGHVHLHTLQCLQQSLNTDSDLMDHSALSEVVREIKQRVAVELAKFQVTKKILSSSAK